MYRRVFIYVARQPPSFLILHRAGVNDPSMHLGQVLTADLEPEGRLFGVTDILEWVVRKIKITASEAEGCRRKQKNTTFV